MAQVKAHEVDRALQKLNPAHRVYLIYGPDNGLVVERGKIVAKASGADLDDAFATIVIDADDAASDPSRIADEAHTISMFGGNRLVWIRGTTQKNLVAAIKPILELPPTDAVVVIEAGDLKKSAPLRTAIEKSPAALALPCYQDQARSIENIINDELKVANLTMEPAARSLLISLLGSDRMASRGEVTKLCLYAAGNETVTTADVSAIVGDASALALNTVVDAAATGDVATMEHMFKRLVAQGTAVFQIISATQRHAQSLHQARSQMESSGTSAASAIGTMRPPVNFQRKDHLVTALNLWTCSALEKVLGRLDAVSLESRANAALAVPLASTALLAMALEARQRSRKFR